MEREGTDGMVATPGELGAQLGDKTCTQGENRHKVISNGKHTYPHTEEKDKTDWSSFSAPQK